MEISLLLLSFLITFQLFFVGIFLVTHRKGKKRNNILLGTIFLLIAWNIGDMTFRIGTSNREYHAFQFIDDGFLLLYGPLFFLYTKVLIIKSYKIKMSWLLHLLPYLGYTIVLILSIQLSVEFYNPVRTEELPWQIHVLSWFPYLHILIYLILTFREVRNYRKVILNQFSKIDHINLGWLNFTLKTLAVITLLSVIHNYMLLSGPIYVLTSLAILLLFIFYFVNRVIFKALNQPEIFAGIEESVLKKYEGSYLSTEQIDRYKQQLLSHIEDEKPYLNPQISLQDLSTQLQISTKNLSQVINQGFGKNFFDYINSFRIKEAQQIMTHDEDPKLTILEVMYKSGFNSKSSFNTAFKKATGDTPSDYKRSL